MNSARLVYTALLWVTLGACTTLGTVETTIFEPPQNETLNRPSSLHIAIEGKFGGVISEGLARTLPKRGFHTIAHTRDGSDTLITGRLKESYSLNEKTERCGLDLTLRLVRLDGSSNKPLLTLPFSASTTRPRLPEDDPRRVLACEEAARTLIRDIEGHLNPQPIAHKVRLWEVEDSQGHNARGLERLRRGERGEASRAFLTSFEDPELETKQQAMVLYNLATVQYLSGHVLGCTANVAEAMKHLDPEDDINTLKHRCAQGLRVKSSDEPVEVGSIFKWRTTPYPSHPDKFRNAASEALRRRTRLMNISGPALKIESLREEYIAFVSREPCYLVLVRVLEDGQFELLRMEKGCSVKEILAFDLNGDERPELIWISEDSRGPRVCVIVLDEKKPRRLVLDHYIPPHLARPGTSVTVSRDSDGRPSIQMGSDKDNYRIYWDHEENKVSFHTDSDRDQDGVVDILDLCPDQSGSLTNRGCLPEDKDCDSLIGGADRCPNDREDFDGFEDGDGCPDGDNDRDGFCDPWIKRYVDDNQLTFDDAVALYRRWSCMGSDACPLRSAKGATEYKGCPGPKRVVVTAAEIEIKEVIYFKELRDIILKESYSLLDEVTETILTNSHIRLIEIQGHTDTTHSEAVSNRLSQERAIAVRRYLIERGVPAHKLSAKGYGKTRPKARGKVNPENRRVEFHILKQDATRALEQPR